jgi:hypothetical protein
MVTVPDCQEAQLHAIVSPRVLVFKIGDPFLSRL